MLYKHFILAVFLSLTTSQTVNVCDPDKCMNVVFSVQKKDTSFSDLFMISFKNKKFDTFNIMNNPEKATTVTLKVELWSL